MSSSSTLTAVAIAVASLPSFALPRVALGAERTDNDAASTNAARTKPYAPLEALIPAARVKYAIDKSVELLLAKTATTTTSNPIDELSQLWLTQPQNFTKGARIPDVPNQPAKSYLDKYSKNLERVPVLLKPGAYFVESGEIDSWKRLKRQERTREKADDVRAAFNVYTSNLSFDAESYLLNVPKDVRSKMIRDDQLPDVQNVIASDMGLRYLYRNDVLTALDDVRAELQYLVKQQQQQQSSGGNEYNDLIELLLKAQTATNRWFDLIDERDVSDAMEAVRQEQTRQ